LATKTDNSYYKHCPINWPITACAGSERYNNESISLVLDIHSSCFPLNWILDHKSSNKTDNSLSFQFKNCFSINVPTGDGQQQFILRANSDQECTAWIEAIIKSRLLIYAFSVEITWLYLWRWLQQLSLHACVRIVLTVPLSTYNLYTTETHNHLPTLLHLLQLFILIVLIFHDCGAVNVNMNWIWLNVCACNVYAAVQNEI